MRLNMIDGDPAELSHMTRALNPPGAPQLLEVDISDGTWLVVMITSGVGLDAVRVHVESGG